MELVINYIYIKLSSNKFLTHSLAKKARESFFVILFVLLIYYGGDNNKQVVHLGGILPITKNCQVGSLYGDTSGKNKMKITKIIKNDLKESIANFSWPCKVQIMDETPEEYFDRLAAYVDISKYDQKDLLCGGVTYCREKDNSDQVVFFMDGLMMIMERIGRLNLEVIVAHEWRHSQQFVWLRKYGLVKKVVDDEIKAPYGAGVLENDAKSFSEKGIDKNFEEVFANYL